MGSTRRVVLLSGLTAAATRIAATPTEAVSSARTQDTTPPGLDREIRFDEAARAAAAEDFGHILRKMPKGVLQPNSASDVAATIRWAGKRGLKFVAQGQRHSVFGRSMAHDGIAADLSRLQTIHSVKANLAVVDAGATWSEVLAATLPLGLTPPVLTDYLGLSIGGTLTVGGIGGRTPRFGFQSDNVVSMEVVTGTGREVICSANANADLFDSVRAGLGQVAVITRVTLKLIAAPPLVRRYLLSYPDLNAMLHDQRLLAHDNRFDVVLGAIVPGPGGSWLFRLDATKGLTNGQADDVGLLTGLADNPANRQASTQTYFEYLNRLATLEKTLRSNGQWFLPHPWLATFIGDSNVEAVVGRELARMGPADLGTFGQVVLSAFWRKPVTTPLLRLPSDELCYAFNLVRIPTAGGATEIGRLLQENRLVHTRVRDAGGTLYPVSAFPMRRDDWRQHFGAAFGSLSDAKRKFDPHNVLTPGYEIF